MESFDDPFTESELKERVESEIALYQELNPVAVVIGFTLSVTISARAAKVPLVYVLPFPLTRPFLEVGLSTFPDEFDYPFLRIFPSKFFTQVPNRQRMAQKYKTLDKAFSTSCQALMEFHRLRD